MQSQERQYTLQQPNAQLTSCDIRVYAWVSTSCFSPHLICFTSAYIQQRARFAACLLGLALWFLRCYFCHLRWKLSNKTWLPYTLMPISSYCRVSSYMKTTFNMPKPFVRYLNSAPWNHYLSWGKHLIFGTTRNPPNWNEYGPKLA